jgi:hypothetical protein
MPHCDRTTQVPIPVGRFATNPRLNESIPSGLFDCQQLHNSL